MAGVTHLQESEGHAKYGATSYKGRIGERQGKKVAHDACSMFLERRTAQSHQSSTSPMSSVPESDSWANACTGSSRAMNLATTSFEPKLVSFLYYEVGRMTRRRMEDVNFKNLKTPYLLKIGQNAAKKLLNHQSLVNMQRHSGPIIQLLNPTATVVWMLRPEDDVNTGWGARIHQGGGGGGGGEEDGRERRRRRRRRRRKWIVVKGADNHGRMTQDDTRPQGRESDASPLHQWRRTSDDSDRVSQACSTLRGYVVKKFYNVVTNFFHFQERSEYINFSPDSITITRIPPLPSVAVRLPLPMFVRRAWATSKCSPFRSRRGQLW
ncbi:uncharacterized protein LACBIDRAFT_335925 [Laccaria bicolor S238N-H82]|uniref:Predicted protein n=1 Tax=Laccaria bicolor (strain S238N-H82 / ATCC MYA-4686) TaxID=486041 RepID=B0E3V1_LACBS|nr:uncharacterized protein LACBIDRAFT_335925 [Laccaria bicolor S238N-H82]EDQ98484.1 predicted protein [Laccaria bicolor S238N-H82]|eukprot:XP_001890869.1 predicted protein [Laccaria bicolor S238N-H82]